MTCPAFLDFHGAGDVMFDITGLNKQVGFLSGNVLSFLFLWILK